MKALFMAASIFALSSTALAKGDTQTSCYDVDGMTCAACEGTLKAGVKKLDGIKKIVASVETGDAKITFDAKKTNAKEIKAAIDKIGYKAKAKQCKV